jgi:hypothetical protein
MQQDSDAALLGQRQQRNISAEVADTALAWAGKSYKPGESFRCQDFVNHVLDQTYPDLANRIGTSRNPVDGMESGPLLASRFAGSDVSQRVSLKDAQPGDIVVFTNTFKDENGREYPKGTITHVGIYVGDGKMVHRPTSDRSVELTSVDIFNPSRTEVQFYRPHAYERIQQLENTPQPPSTRGLRADAEGGGPSLLEQAERAFAKLPAERLAQLGDRDAAVLGAAFTAHTAKFDKIAEVMPDTAGNVWVFNRPMSDQSAQRAAFDPNALPNNRIDAVMTQLQAPRQDKPEAIAVVAPATRGMG